MDESISRSGADSCFLRNASPLLFVHRFFLFNSSRYQRRNLYRSWHCAPFDPVKNDVWLKDQIYSAHTKGKRYKILFRLVFLLVAKTNILMLLCWWTSWWKKWCNENNKDRCQDLLSRSDHNGYTKRVYHRLPEGESEKNSASKSFGLQTPL